MRPHRHGPYCLVTLALCIFSSGLQSQNTWELVSPKIPNASLEAVRGTATGLVLAVGSMGVALRSVDSGATWSVIKTGTTKWLYGVCISASGKCIAVGENGTILVSTDQGLTWTQKESGVSGTLLAVGWLADSIAIAGGQSGKLIKTTDSGQNWTLLSSQTSEQIEYIQFLTDSLGFASVADTLLKTMNAGKSWTKHMMAPPYWSHSAAVQFVNERVGYMASATGFVRKTTDGGNSWVLLQNLATYNTGIYCLDTATAIIVGRETTYKMTGGGTAFTAIDHVPERWLLDVTFISPSLGFAVGRNGQVLRTTDAGLTWRNAIDQIHSDLTDVSFWSESCGVAIGTDLNAHYTSDSGKTWISKPTPVVFNNVSFVDSVHGFATKTVTEQEHAPDVYSSVWRTSDAGENWKLLFKSGDYYTTYRGIRFWDSLQGCVVGDYYHFMGHYGVVLYYVFDGREFWRSSGINSIESGAYPNVSSLSIVNSLTGYALYASTAYLTGSRSSRLVRTTNGGQSWSGQGDGVFSPPSVVHFVNQMTGTIVEYGGRILRSEDGGVTWREQVNPGSKALTNVCFGTPTIGVAVGPGGTIISTTDGGANWKIETSPTMTDLAKVDVSPGGNVVAIGNAGVIVRGHVRLGSPLPPIDTVGHRMLSQNYPNPFSGLTTISFALEQPHVVMLRVFDLLGREVATLLHGEVGEGWHTKIFDGTNLPSGIYLVRLQAGGRTETHKIVLLK